jgi:hypothetical protein
MENDALKTLKESKSRAEDTMKRSESLRRILPERDMDFLKKSLTLMTGQLEKIISGEKISPTKEEVVLVADVVRVFANIAIEKPIEPIFRDLSASLLLIAHNWNLATINNPDIEAHIKLADGLIKAQLTLMDTIFVVQKILDKVRKTHAYEPPAFNLSRAYLDNLKKAIEEKGSDALVPPKKEEPAGANQ